MGCVRRRSWQNNEINAVETFFKQYLDSGKLPSLHHCDIARLTNPAIQSRSPTQIKLWISNQIMKKKRISQGLNNFLLEIQRIILYIMMPMTILAC